MKKILLTLSTIGLLQAMATDIIVIAHANVPKMDTKTIAKVFTGKAVIVNNVPVTPFNFEEITLRNEFLQKFLGMNEEEYIAYWTVRQYIGKGAEPRKVSPIQAMIEHIKNTPGAIGYIPAQNLQSDLNIIEKK